MKLPHRRQFLHLAAGAAALPAISRVAIAQVYPSRPVKLVIGYPPGAGADFPARLSAQWLSERLGQQFVVENRPGADSNIATEAVAKAIPDGYTLLYVTATNAINATLFKNLSFNFVRDIAPVSGFIRAPTILELHPSVPAKSVPELIAYAKANPGRLNMASQGVGSTQHVFGELFKFMADIDMTHVPYRSNPLTDLLAGTVQVMFAPPQNTIEHVRTGKLRALAVTGVSRLEALPEVPTMNTFLPGYEAYIWSGIGAPKGTPAEIIEKLHTAIDAGLRDATLKARIATSGATPMPMGPTEFAKLIADETEKWGKVIRAANIKPE